ncbi:MAG: MBG domain-containing protein [Limosilactobacillus sp.]|jgi:LPXTG-motif cell wall-anchored protein|uniref:MBG domain-containing protein n=1 Tax=Limosilactobacillus sp. TaxID=2773925 RepID=UPI0025B9EC74|nr:MBG domain-containing protein [Limosilactobacillus sp.]MCI1974433.1 MBG domain-containing protein [Limosilactobacillus sp.]
MGKNNQQRRMVPERKNFKLYKAKKQWLTACATFMFAFGASAVMNVAQADKQPDEIKPHVEEVEGSSTTGKSLVANSSVSLTKSTTKSTDNANTSAQPTSQTQQPADKSATSTVTKAASGQTDSDAISAVTSKPESTQPASASEQDNSAVNSAKPASEIPASATTQTTSSAGSVTKKQSSDKQSAKSNIPVPVTHHAVDSSGTTNGGYNSATWGTLDTSKWTGQTATFNGTSYYQLTKYTGDQAHIIVPNEADFEAANQSTNNPQVAISNDLLKGLAKNATTIAFSKTGDKKVKLVSDNLDSTFENNSNLEKLDANNLDTSSVTSMKKTFHAAPKLSSLTGISGWDVSNVTSMTETFRGMNSLHTLAGLENWDVRKVTDMNNIFNEENTSNNVDISALSNWKTSSLQNLSTAFANIKFTNLHGLESWDVSHVTNMNSLFENDDKLTDISALANWKTGNVQNFGSLFASAYKLTDLGALANWNTSSATDIDRAFNGTGLINYHGLENWDTSKVTNFEAMFANEGALVDASGIANWNTGSVTNMNALFTGSSPQYLDFSKWDFSKVNKASDVIKNIKTVVYLGNNSTMTADKLSAWGLTQANQPIIFASGALYTLLSSNKNNHKIKINNANNAYGTPGTQIGTISVPVVYNAGTASDATAAMKSYQDMVEHKVQQYVDDNNCALKLISKDPVNDLTGHNNHLVNYAQATYAKTAVTVQLIDDDDHGSQVGSTQGGILDKSDQVKFTIPANYQLAQNPGLTITQTGNQATLTHDPTGGQVTVQIHLVHQTKQVDGNTAGLPEDVKKSLNKDISRTINYTGLTSEQVNQIPAAQRTQTVHLTGKATYDLVTKKLVSDITWDPAQINGFTPKNFAGYVSRVVGTNGNQVSQITVTADSQPEAVTVNYKKAQFKINVWDNTTNQLLFPDGYEWEFSNTIGYVTIVPSNYHADNYQSIGVTGVPYGVKITGDQKKDLNQPDTRWWIPNYYCDSDANKYDLAGSTIMIHVVHKLKDVTIKGSDGKTYDGQPGTFGSDKPITITGTDAATGKKDIKLVSKDISINDFVWNTDAAHDAPSEAGNYKLDFKDNATKKAIIDILQKNNSEYGISYIYPNNLGNIHTELDYHITPASKVVVRYYDVTGKEKTGTEWQPTDGTEIASQIENFVGKGGDPFSLDSLSNKWNYDQVGWKFVGQNSVTKYPTSGTTTPDGNYYVGNYNVYLKAAQPISKTITRTIINKLPSGTVTTTQKGLVSRTHSVDKTTGKVSYGEWKNGTWDAFNVPTQAGYLLKITQEIDGQSSQIKSINKETVTFNSKPVTITISYQEVRFTIKVQDDTTGNELYSKDYSKSDGDFWDNFSAEIKNHGDYQSVKITGEPKSNPNVVTSNRGQSFTDPNTQWWFPNVAKDPAALAGQTFVIHVVHKLKDVTISGSDGKTYDGQPGTFGNDKPITITGTDMVDNSQKTLDIADITTADFKWNDASHTNAGSYTLTPKDQAKLIQTLQKDNPKYGVAYLKSIGGQLNYTIKSKVTFEFVDHDNNDTVIGRPVTQGMTINEENTITRALTIPDKYVLATGQTLPTSYKPTSNAPIVKIQLAHKIDDVQETATRTATVHYIYANGDKAGQKAAADAVLEVAYKRTNKKDEVTGQVTDGNWLWDQSKNDDGFTHGYKAVHGDWTLPQNWANVSVKNPDVTGYTAITKGDWEINKDGTQSNVPANQFVFPTYAGRGTSTEGDNSVAYTDEAPVYEARPVHTVYYAEVKDEGRLVTKSFKKYDNGTYTDADVITLPNGTKQSYAQIKVWYQGTPTEVVTNKSSDPKNWQVTYDWTWNKDGGDQSTPGFTVISGQGLWHNIENGGSWGITAPDLSGYTVVSLRQDIGRHSVTSGAPKVTLDGETTATAFTDSADDWYYKNNLTTYYVPNADLQRTITRTIKIAGEDPVTQTVTFNRMAYINLDDTGIVFGAIIGGDAYKNVIGDNVWNHNSSDPDGIPTGTWDEYDLTKRGYTAVINGQAVTKVVSETVSPDSKDQTVNVSYIKNVANITINHAQVTVTYGEKVEIPAGITNSVAAGDPLITLPAGSNNVRLSTDDFLFADKNSNILRQSPVNVGNYRIVLNGHGLAKFKALDSNFTWNYDPKASYVEYKITASKNVVSVSGTQTETYNDSAQNVAYNADGNNSVTVSISRAADNQNGALASLTGVTLDSGDFKIVNAAGKGTQAINANGTYHIVLTDLGLGKIKDKLGSNYAITQANTFGTLQINKATATATLTGQNNRNYNGSAVSRDDLYAGTNGNITVTIAIPNSDKTISYTLKNGDYTWDTAGHVAPTDHGTYTFQLNKDKVLAGLQAAIAGDSTWKGNVTLSADNLTGSAQFDINQRTSSVSLDGSESVTYNGKQAETPLGQLKDKISATNLVGHDAHLDLSGLTASDFDWYKGTTKLDEAPTDHGNYTIKLKADGLTALQNKNKNYKLSINDQQNEYGYVINTAKGTIKLANTHTITFGDSDPDYYQNYQLTLGTTTKVDGFTPSYTLQAGDLQFSTDGSNWSTSVPTGVGEYHVSLSQAGFDHIKDANGENGNVVWPATYSEITDSAKYVINAATATAELGGNATMQYDGQPAEPSDLNGNGSTIKVTVTIPGKTGEHDYTLQAGDYTWDAGSTPVNVGKNAYKLSFNLSDTGKAHLKAFIDGIAGKGLNDVSNVNIPTAVSGNAYLTITPVAITVTQGGSGDKTYNSQPAAVSVDTVKAALSASGLIGDQNFKTDSLTATDFDWYKGNDDLGKLSDAHVAPTDAGDYTIKLNADGLKTLQDANSNYSFDAVADAYKYTINKADGTIVLAGSDSRVFDNQETTSLDGSKYSITINGVKYDLAAGQYEIVDADGHKATVKNAGTYYVVLTDNSLTSDKNYNWTITPNGTQRPNQIGTYTITPASQVVIHYRDVNDVTAPASEWTPTSGTPLNHDQTVNGIPGNSFSFNNVSDKWNYAGAHYVLAGQIELGEFPTSGTLSSDGNYYVGNYYVYLKHKTTSASQTKDITRTIIEYLPSGATKTTKQIVTLEQTGTKDLVTNEIKWNNDWTTGKWNVFIPKTVSDYTAEPASVAAEVVNIRTVPVTINIYYKRNPVIPPVPETATEKVQFVDESGKVVASQDYSGNLGQIIPVELTVPAGYKLAAGQELPTEIKIENGAITIKVVSEGSDHPDHPDNPDQPVNPDHPDNPNQPVTPDHPENNGDNTGKPGEGGNVPGHSNVTPGHIANDNSISSQIAHHTNGTHDKTKQLPQTGNTANEKAVTLGFLFAGLASIFGFTGLRKKKKQ